MKHIIIYIGPLFFGNNYLVPHIVVLPKYKNEFTLSNMKKYKSTMEKYKSTVNYQTKFQNKISTLSKYISNIHNQTKLEYKSIVTSNVI